MTCKYAVENAIIEPMVFLIATDNWMEFTLRYVVDFKKSVARKTCFLPTFWMPLP